MPQPRQPRQERSALRMRRRPCCTQTGQEGTPGAAASSSRERRRGRKGGSKGRRDRTLAQQHFWATDGRTPLAWVGLNVRLGLGPLPGGRGSQWGRGEAACCSRPTPPRHSTGEGHTGFLALVPPARTLERGLPPLEAAAWRPTPRVSFVAFLLVLAVPPACVEWSSE